MQVLQRDQELENTELALGITKSNLLKQDSPAVALYCGNKCPDMSLDYDAGQELDVRWILPPKAETTPLGGMPSAHLVQCLAPALAVSLCLDGYGNRILGQITPVSMIDCLVGTALAQLVDDGVFGALV